MYKPKLFPWITIYRKLKRYCSNPNSKYYHLFGEKGIHCIFSSSREVHFLYKRDKANDMKKPHLARYHRFSTYSKDNCYFAEFEDVLIQTCKQVCKDEALKNKRGTEADNFQREIALMLPKRGE